MSRSMPAPWALVVALSTSLCAWDAVALPAAAEVARRYGDAIVVVERPCPATVTQPRCAPTRTQGFFVSSTGLFATVMPGLQVGDVVSFQTDTGTAPGNATVVGVDTDGLALAALVPEPTAPVAALAVSSTGTKSRWLIGLSRDPRGVQAVVGGVEPQGLLVPVPRGAPVLNEDHEVIAVCTRSRGGGTIDVLPVERLRDLAARVARDAFKKATAKTPATATTATTATTTTEGG